MKILRKIYKRYWISLITWLILITTGLWLISTNERLQFSTALNFTFVVSSVAVLCTTLFFYFTHLRPFYIILHEMKALLTGKRYRRIGTIRNDEVGIMAHFFNEITHNLEKISNSLNEHRRISKELDIAHQIQQKLLPTKAPDCDDLDIIAKTKPAEEIGGDSFDFLEKEENLFIYMGDVTGHGVPAGLVMIMVDTLLDTFVDNKMNSKEVLVNTNKYLQPKLNKAMFMTMVMYRWNKKEKKMYYTGAGHEHVLIYKAKTNECVSFPAGGIALGMVADNEKILVEKEIEFESGDTLILYSDGITEGENDKGEQYGLERLKSIAQKAGHLKDSGVIFETISHDYSDFLQGQLQDDDISLMVIRRK